MRPTWYLVMLVGLGACRQPNPEWKGSSDSLGDTMSDSDPSVGDASVDGSGDGSSAGPVGCTEPTIDCGGICVDVQTSKQNCGACGVRCQGNQKCTEGVCG